MKYSIILLLAFSSHFLFGQSDCVPKRPNKLVNDYTQTLSAGEIAQLEAKLVGYNDTTSTQIAIVILPDLCGGDANMLAVEIAHEWGVGQKGEDNGCIILMSMEDGNRKIAIQNGYGLEAYLTDAITRRIIETAIIPDFKQNDYYNGLDKGTTAIMQVLAGTFKGDGGGSSNPKIPKGIIIFIIMIVLFSIFNRKGGRGGRGGGGYWIGGFGTGGYSGGGGGFSGGGGFGGFGGGGFGGGGASGSW